MLNNRNNYDEEKLSEIYDIYSKLLLKIAFTYLKSVSLAEDIVQDVFLKYMLKAPSFENEKNEKAWLIRVTINLCKDYLKSSWFKKKVELKEEISYLPQEEIDVLSEVFKLPEKYRIVIYLYYYEGYSIKEVSSIMRVKSATIGTWLARAKQSLRINLEEDFENE